MQLTKYTHACVRFDDGDRHLVIDPGSFSEVAAATDGVSAILITHEHHDHVDVDKVRAVLAADSRQRLYAPSSVAAGFADLGEQVVTVNPGDEFEAGGFTIQAFGGQHAVVHPSLGTIANVGYLIEGVYHPGDSFFVPSAPISTLLVPTNGPWSKASEVVDFAVAVRAPKAFQIHDSLITSNYAGIVEGLLGRIAGPHGVDFAHLEVEQTVTV